ncbi:MAG TPA: hypothetical protein VEJ37_00790 [Xanthobacteraceae bacterium]|nr:hypothetical protein [Xanthobacteraceae bacterium]
MAIAALLGVYCLATVGMMGLVATTSGPAQAYYRGGWRGGWRGGYYRGGWGRGRYWGGRWWGYGVGPCWRSTPAGWVWICG